MMSAGVGYLAAGVSHALQVDQLRRDLIADKAASAKYWADKKQKEFERCALLLPKENRS